MDYAKLNGLIPAVAQDDETGEVLMVGFMNEEALEQTQKSGLLTFYSRSRQQLWIKGETSGNTLRVQRILADCDNDSVVVRVTRQGSGNVCHTGTRSCFTREIPFLMSAFGDRGSLFDAAPFDSAPFDSAPFDSAQGGQGGQGAQPGQARNNPGQIRRPSARAVGEPAADVSVLQERGQRPATEVRS
jgi:phosphoribosyl-AMP cyclohydrolase